jgi:uncharacterized protein YhfF
LRLNPEVENKRTHARARAFRVMNNSDLINFFWQEFCRTANVNSETPYQVWFFGNTSEMARELAELVISGKKTATASLVEFNETHPESAPVENGFSVVTDFEGNPLCVIQTNEIRHLPFTEVDAQFAFDEGEGDQTLRYWCEVHQQYFTKEAKEFNLEFNENSLIACERFRLLFSK